MDHQPTAYELKAWTEIQYWEQRTGGPLAKLGRAIDKPITWAGDKVFATRAGGGAAKAIERFVEILSGTWTVRIEYVPLTN